MGEKKIFYKPREFAKSIGVSVKTLQRWDNEGILKADRTPGGRRQYTARHIIELRRRSPETCRGEEIGNANLWLHPYPLKNFEEGHIFVDPKHADRICHAFRQDCGISSITDYTLSAKYAGHNVVLSPVVAAAGPDVLSGIVFGIELKTARESLIVADQNLTPGCVDLTGRIPVLLTEDEPDRVIKQYLDLFNAFTDELGHAMAKFIYVESWYAMVFLPEMCRNEDPSKKPLVMNTLISIDKYLTAHPEIKDIVSQV